MKINFGQNKESLQMNTPYGQPNKKHNKLHYIHAVDNFHSEIKTQNIEKTSFKPHYQ